MCSDYHLTMDFKNDDISEKPSAFKTYLNFFLVTSQYHPSQHLISGSHEQQGDPGAPHSDCFHTESHAGVTAAQLASKLEPAGTIHRTRSSLTNVCKPPCPVVSECLRTGCRWGDHHKHWYSTLICKMYTCEIEAEFNISSFKSTFNFLRIRDFHISSSKLGWAQPWNLVQGNSFSLLV